MIRILYETDMIRNTIKTGMNGRTAVQVAAVLLALLLFPSVPLHAQNFDIDVDSLARSHFSADSLSDEVIDRYDLKRKKIINDYSMIGVQYGVGLSRTLLQPETAKEDMIFMPYNIGVLYTRYGKMFGYMPYFGFQAGVFYTQEGYKFRYDSKKNAVPVFFGAQSAVMDVVEVPVLAHCHADFWKMKLILNAGLYVGYRLNIHRYEPDNRSEVEYVVNLTPDYPYEYVSFEREFADFENRFDFGIKGGLGFAFMFDPVEIHIQAMYKHSFSSLFKANYYSAYYYRYSYQQNVIISLGLHFQLGKRVGKTRQQLRKEARAFVTGETVPVREGTASVREGTAPVTETAGQDTL